MSARHDAKAALTALLTTALLDPGRIQAIYNHRVPDINTQSPVVVLDMVGSGHPAPDVYGGWPVVANINVVVYVSYSEQGTAYTPEQAEEILADIEARISAVIQANQSTTAWSRVEYSGDTQIWPIPAVIGGNTYKFEVVPLALRVG